MLLPDQHVYPVTGSRQDRHDQKGLNLVQHFVLLDENNPVYTVAADFDKRRESYSFREDDAMPKFERIMIESALSRTGGKRQEAAKLLGWGRNTLTRKIKELGME